MVTDCPSVMAVAMVCKQRLAVTVFVRVGIYLQPLDEQSKAMDSKAICCDHSSWHMAGRKKAMAY